MQLAVAVHPGCGVHTGLAIHRCTDQCVLQRFEALARVGGQRCVARMSGQQRTSQRQGREQRK